jgi:hypothetical protein
MVIAQTPLKYNKAFFHSFFSKNYIYQILILPVYPLVNNQLILKEVFPIGTSPLKVRELESSATVT